MNNSTAPLEVNEHLPRMYFDAAGDAIIACNAEGHAIECNQAALDLFGCTRAQFIGSNPATWSPEFQPDGRRSDEAAADKFALAKVRGLVHLEWENRRLDGTAIPVDVTIRFIRIENNDSFIVISRDISERRRGEALRKEAQDRFQRITELVPGVVYQFKLRPDGTTCMPYASHAFNALFHLDADEVREDAKKVLLRVHPDDLPGLMDSIQVSAKNMTPWQHEHRLKYDDGTVCWVLGNSLPQLQADGSIVWHGFITDISERKESGKTLQRRNSMMERTERMARLASFEWDVDANIVTWSPEMYHIFGRDPALGIPNLEGQTELYTPASTQILFEAVNKAVLDGTPYEIELMTVQPDGEQRPCIAKGFPERDASGRVVRVAGLVKDITQQKAAEAKLQLAASVFDQAREGITITNVQGTIINVNAAFTRITGYSRQEAIGQNPRILSSGRQDKAFYEAMWNALIVQGHWSGEVWNRRKNGEVYAELLTISALKDLQGNTQQYVALFSDITAIKEYQSQLEHIAHFDALTNLPNRLLLADRVQQAIAHAQRRGEQVAVAYLDLDGFKNINDNHGHDVGDQLLIHVATAMKDTLREGDTLARLGGDEFVAILIDIDGIESCLPMLTRLLAAAATPVQLGEVLLQGSASIGVTFYPQADEVGADQLLRQADQAMYQAKLAGKNRYHVFDAVQDSSLRLHHESIKHIRLALTRSEFVLHYQPKVNMRSGQVIGAEALIRWQHPEKGLLAPAAFLPVIEEHPLAVEVGEWVIEAAVTQIERWNVMGLNLPVSVNIGARQLQQADFVQRLQATLDRHPDVNPASLELEVLETSALADMKQVSQVIEECHQMGVTFALDDFGTGYSSLTYLKRLQVALLKIDQSFVRDMLGDPDDLAILQGVIGLAAAFKREVIAEGVETVAHGTALLQLGCELAQGYGIARPMPALELPAWVDTWQPDPAWCVMPKSRDMT